MDDKTLWKAVSWKGELLPASSYQSKEKPSDEQFGAYFNNLLNPPNQARLDPTEFQGPTTIPILDDPITPEEVQAQVRRLKPNKACGPDGVSPAVLKLLPPAWILLITTVFNNIFTTHIYPTAWTTATLTLLYKKGSRLLPGNYRGISIMNSLSKLFDMVLCARLELWFRPLREQAGAQAGRGCMEHIVTLRLLTDYAKRKKIKLYVTFVDYSAAYDNVPRYGLFQMMQRLGCGARMLACLVAMYAVTRSIIGSITVTGCIGVRQGAPTSCFLFVLFLETMVRMFKERCFPDGFLAWLHLLVLMDDTVILSTTREGMLRKLKILHEFCNQNNMKVNLGKTKFMVINGDEHDKHPLTVEDLVVRWCEQYVYLGSVFTVDGMSSSAIAADAKIRMAQVIKFISFVQKNNDVPFFVKIKVFKACVMSSLLYGCESWLSGDLRPISRAYMMCIKALLSVRNSTTNDLCLAELGLPEVKAIVLEQQKKYFKKMQRSRHNIPDDPFAHALALSLGSRTHTSRYLSNLIDGEITDVRTSLETIRTRILNNPRNSNRLSWYIRVNPTLSVHPTYTQKFHAVNDLHRVAWSRLRLSAHSLAIEEGRWNRRGRGRLPEEERLCSCGEIQTEAHVIEQCHRTAHLRQQHGFLTVEELMTKNISQLCEISSSILNIYY